MMGVNLKEGTHNICIDDLDSLTSGTYRLEVKNSDGRSLYNIQLIKQ
jgi:hypothetical protein